MKRAMEVLLPKMQLQIIADFYRKNVSKGKMYSIQYFKWMGCKKNRNKWRNAVSWCRWGIGVEGEAGKAMQIDKSPGKEGDILRSWRERPFTRLFTYLHTWAYKEIAVYILVSFFALCLWNLPLLMFSIVWIDHTRIYQPLNSAFLSQFA